jgi:hypothetical protein
MAVHDRTRLMADSLLYALARGIYAVEATASLK